MSPASARGDPRPKKRNGGRPPRRPPTSTANASHQTDNNRENIFSGAGGQSETALSPSPVRMSPAEMRREFYRRRAERGDQLRRAAERLRSGAPIFGFGAP
jgi:hypothetical protein